MSVGATALLYSIMSGPMLNTRSAWRSDHAALRMATEIRIVSFAACTDWLLYADHTGTIKKKTDSMMSGCF
jgi:hypothetical protein